METPGSGIIVKGFVSEEELSELYDCCRLVVAPLRYGAGVKGKIIEAIYHGAPIVTTSIGAEGIPDAGSVMQIADTPDAFAGAVTELYQDPQACLALCRSISAWMPRGASLRRTFSGPEPFG